MYARLSVQCYVCKTVRLMLCMQECQVIFLVLHIVVNTKANRCAIWNIFIEVLLHVFFHFRCLISGVVGIVAAARFGDLERKNETPKTRFPYSLFIFGLGSVILVLVSFALLFEIWHRHQLSMWDDGPRYPPKRRLVSDPYRSHSHPDDEYDRASYPYRKYRDDRPYYTEERRERYPQYESRRFVDDRPYVVEEKVLPPITTEYVKVLPPYGPEPVIRDYDRPFRDYDRPIRDFDRPSRPYSLTYEYLPRDSYRPPPRYIRSSPRDYEEDSPYVVSVNY